MNWIKENKFLSGFIGVLVIAAGALGYLLYTAWSTYSDVSDQYNSQASALHQYQTRVPYPDQGNLTKYRAEEGDFVDATHDLASNLSQMVLPVVEMTPSAFQDRLRETVSDVVTRAGKTGVKLPEHFSMDFDKYQSSPPAAEAAGPLGRQLTALKIAMDILLNEHVDAVVSLRRTPLPQEGGGAAAESRNDRFGRRGGGGGGVNEGGLVVKYPFEIQFTAGQPAFQKVLNDFASSTRQFFITRTLLVENSDPKPVSKGGDSTSAASAPAQGPGAAANPAPAPGLVMPGSVPAAQPGGPATMAAGGAPAGSMSYLKFIVGTEKLNVAMRVDMVAFNPPEKSARK